MGMRWPWSGHRLRATPSSRAVDQYIDDKLNLAMCLSSDAKEWLEEQAIEVKVRPVYMAMHGFSFDRYLELRFSNARSAMFFKLVWL